VFQGVNQKERALLGRGFGSSGRTRTYNPSVNSRMLYLLLVTYIEISKQL